MYKHTQLAWVIWAFLLWIASFLAIAVVLIGNNIGVIGFAILLLVVAVIFYGLTIKVDNKTKNISWWFGPGIGKVSLDFAQIKQAKAVRNSFRHGIGMRISNDGWVYSVSGFDAVELTLHDGMKYRIGSNDVEGLLSILPTEITIIVEETNKAEQTTEEAKKAREKKNNPFDFS